MARTEMRLDDLTLWHLGNTTAPRFVGALKLVSAGVNDGQEPRIFDGEVAVS